MPRFTAPAPNSESRKALEQRAREASKPAAPQEKGRWPFPVADNGSAAGKESPHGNAGNDTVQQD